MMIPLMLRGTMAGTRYEFERIKRLIWPNRYDHAAYMLIHILGPWWLFLTGWKREWRIMGVDSNGSHKTLMIDLAHPRLKLALEADGERWHMDVAREYERDYILKARGYSVRHYRYPVLKNHPRRVRRQVRRWFWLSLLFKLRR